MIGGIYFGGSYFGGTEWVGAVHVRTFTLSQPATASRSDPAVRYFRATQAATPLATRRRTTSSAVAQSATASRSDPAVRYFRATQLATASRSDPAVRYFSVSQAATLAVARSRVTSTLLTQPAVVKVARVWTTTTALAQPSNPTTARARTTVFATAQSAALTIGKQVSHAVTAVQAAVAVRVAAIARGLGLAQSTAPALARARTTTFTLAQAFTLVATRAQASSLVLAQVATSTHAGSITRRCSASQSVTLTIPRAGVRSFLLAQSASVSFTHAGSMGRVLAQGSTVARQTQVSIQFAVPAAQSVSSAWLFSRVAVCSQHAISSLHSSQARSAACSQGQSSFRSGVSSRSASVTASQAPALNRARGTSLALTAASTLAVDRAGATRLAASQSQAVDRGGHVRSLTAVQPTTLACAGALQRFMRATQSGAVTATRQVATLRAQTAAQTVRRAGRTSVSLAANQTSSALRPPTVTGRRFAPAQSQSISLSAGLATTHTVAQPTSPLRTASLAGRFAASEASTVALVSGHVHARTFSATQSGVTAFSGLPAKLVAEIQPFRVLRNTAISRNITVAQYMVLVFREHGKLLEPYILSSTTLASSITGDLAAREPDGSQNANSPTASGATFTPLSRVAPEYIIEGGVAVASPQTSRIS